MLNIFSFAGFKDIREYYVQNQKMNNTRPKAQG